MFGWWRSLEHFSAPGSNPEAVSSERGLVESHALINRPSGQRSQPVLADSNQHGDWAIIGQIGTARLMGDGQRRKYDAARAGRTRGNLGPVPAVDELFVRTLDLDGTSEDRPAHREAPSQQAMRVAEPRVPVVTAIAVERNLAAVFRVERREGSTDAVRAEARLVERYASYLRAEGHDLCRHQITTNSGVSLYTDLFDVTDDVLVEAKSSASRYEIRLGLGQILDYRRYVALSAARLLVPERPIAELLDLLRQFDVQSAWPEGEGWELTG